MPYFEVQLTKKLHRIYDLRQDAVIGRAPQCEIQLLSRAVSRRHARVEFGDQGEAIVSDLGTKNGIKLNGLRVMGAAIVNNGDRVVVGDVTMVFRSGSSGRPESMDAIDLRQRAIGNEDVAAAQQPEAAFCLAAEPAAITQFTSLLGKARIESLDFDPVTQLKLQIALKEALENARAHGCGGDPSKSILVSFMDSPEEFRFSVRDEGGGFDVNGFLANAEEVDALATVRDRPNLGPGLGLKVILNCVDRLQFEDGGATIHMAKFKAGEEVFVISDDDFAPVAASPSPAASPLEETAEETEPLSTTPDASKSWVDLSVESGDDHPTNWWEQESQEGQVADRDELDLDDAGGFDLRPEDE